MDFGNRILSPMEGRLLVWTYSFMYPNREPLPRAQVVEQIEDRIIRAAGSRIENGTGLLDGGDTYWLGAADTEENLFGMVKDFVEDNYWWLWLFSCKAQ